MSGLRYWRADPNLFLRTAVEDYLRDGPLTKEQVAAIRAYLRHWITWPGWKGEGIVFLRAAVEGLTSRRAIDIWLHHAADMGIDPL